MRAANRLRLCGSFGDSWAAQNFREAHERRRRWQAQPKLSLEITSIATE
jgi:hypothetical protein